MRRAGALPARSYGEPRPGRSVVEGRARGSSAPGRRAHRVLGAGGPARSLRVPAARRGTGPGGPRLAAPRYRRRPDRRSYRPDPARHEGAGARRNGPPDRIDRRDRAGRRQRCGSAECRHRAGRDALRDANRRRRPLRHRRGAGRKLPAPRTRPGLRAQRHHGAHPGRPGDRGRRAPARERHRAESHRRDRLWQRRKARPDGGRGVDLERSVQDRCRSDGHAQQRAAREGRGRAGDLEHRSPRRRASRPCPRDGLDHGERRTVVRDRRRPGAAGDRLFEPPGQSADFDRCQRDCVDRCPERRLRHRDLRGAGSERRGADYDHAWPARRQPPHGGIELRDSEDREHDPRAERPGLHDDHERSPGQRQSQPALHARADCRGADLRLSGDAAANGRSNESNRHVLRRRPAAPLSAERQLHQAGRD